MDKALIYKFLSGEAVESEIKELEAWILESEANRDEFEDLKLLFENRQTIEAESEKPDGLMKIKSAMTLLQKDQKFKTGVIWLSTFAMGGAIIIFLKLTGLQQRDFRFENERVRNIIRQLEDQLDVVIEVESSQVLECTFTGSFYQITSAEEIIRVLVKALHLEYEVLNPKAYKLKGAGCRTTFGEVPLNNYESRGQI